MPFSHFQDKYLLLQCLAILSAILFIMLLSIIWDVFFVKRLRHFFHLYRACVEKINSDPFENFFEEALHYKSEIIKYVFLLLTNVNEFMSILIYGLASALIIGDSNNFKHIFHKKNDEGSNCTSELTHSFLAGIRLINQNPIKSVIMSIGQFGFIFSLALSICLLKYLHVTYHDINKNPYRFIRIFLVVTFLIGSLLIITGSVPQLILIYKLIKPIIALTYFCIWVRYIRIFYQTLKWRTIELRIRDGRDWIVRRSVISRIQFSVIMSCMGIVVACWIISEFLGEYFFLIATGIYYGPCLFNLLYGTPYYQPLLSTQQQFDVLRLSHEILGYIISVLLLISAILIGCEYVLGTILFFGGILREKLRYRFGMVRTRYTPDLNHHLLSNQV